MYRVHSPDLPGVWQPHVHESCVHNMVAGLTQRTMGPVVVATPEGNELLGGSFREIRKVLTHRVGDVRQWDLSQVVESYKSKRLRVRYAKAMETILTDGPAEPDHAKVKAFVKAEKTKSSKLVKPRIIMARDPVYNLELASFLKPIEHCMYGNLRGWGKLFYTRTRLVGKGLNSQERAALIKQKFERVPDAVAFEVDGKSFESHISVAALTNEHKVYTSLLRSRRLRQLLSWQVKTRGKGCGVRYQVKGVRASGDFNTGMGNTLIMLSVMHAAFKRLRCRFDALVDGDNAVCFVSRSDLERISDTFPAVCVELGFRMEVGPVASFLEEVVFGQSKPVETANGWTMVRDPLKVLSHAACGYRHYGDPKGGIKVLKSVALCEGVLNEGVPVLQEYAQWMLKSLGKVKAAAGAQLESYEYERVLPTALASSGMKLKPISAAVRESFERAWGLSVEAQLDMERRIRGMKLSYGPWLEPDLVTSDGIVLH